MSGGPEEVVSVSELDRRLRRAVEDASVKLWVEGEVSSLKRAPSGHVYFSLKDEVEDAIVECVMYRFNAQRARRHLNEGARLQLTGQATVWAPRGRLQFVVNEVRPAGRGALLEALEQLKVRLTAEGLFALERKRLLPPEPRVIGVVTSKGGAAFHDIVTVAFRRGDLKIVLAPALVQGEGAPEAIIRALDLIERYPGLDVVILGRGGGSGEDLMAFNDERVVRRVARMRVPVVSAVGHEVDFSLTDLVADVRAATPSQAAELVVPETRARTAVLARAHNALLRATRARLLRFRGEVERARARLSDPRFTIAERQQELDDLHARLRQQAARSIAQRRAHAELLARRLYGRHPRAVLANARAELGPLSVRLENAMRRRLSREAAALSDAAVRLDGLSPLTILGRGYAIATRGDGRALRSAAEVAVGDEIAIRLGRGRIASRVQSISPDIDTPSALAEPIGSGT
ncbi:MAG TPA: exodeoxyribonuclease VII large subunit [Polyangiaceae bacterium]|nr:exodeoxyribonuclease VII large subunit [Polyangiaceae bacterium]